MGPAACLLMLRKEYCQAKTGICTHTEIQNAPSLEIKRHILRDCWGWWMACYALVTPWGWRRIRHQKLWICILGLEQQCERRTAHLQLIDIPPAKGCL